MKPIVRPSLNHRPLGRHLLLGLAGISATCAAPVAITGAGSYAQDFDTLPNSGTTPWTDDTTIASWYAAQTAATFNIAIGAGASNSGGVYSYGAAAATDRALGSLCSGSTGTVSYGVLFQNTGTTAVTLDVLSFTGEQWRNGGNTATQKLTLAYQKSGSPITTPGSAAGWTALTAGDFASPIATATAAALDGNLAANQAAISINPGISVAAGEYLMLRWQDLNDSGNDHGLAIDNLAVSWVAVSTPALTLSATPDNFVENAGAAASTGTVSIPTALGTDLVIDLLSSDLTEAKVPATVTIKAGDLSATFPVDAVNDLVDDSTQNVSISASSSGYLTGQTSLAVDDDTDAPITVTITPLSFSEGAASGTVSGTVALAEVTPVDVVVTLTSNDATEATVPETVTIPANESSATFAVTAVQDTELDGDKSVRIDATAVDYTPGFSRVTVTDDEVPPTPTLSAGAIAFTGYNADGGDDLAFVALVEIPAGEVIFFTDNEWNGLVIGVDGAFNTGEGSLTWTAPAEGVAAGAVVTLNNLSLTTRSASVGTIAAAGSFNMSGDSETVYAYQGTSATAATGFLAVIASWAGDSIANTGLSANQVVVLTTDVDIAAYIGSRSNKPTFAGYLDSLVVMDNWITEDGTGDQSVGETLPNVPFDTTAFTLGSASAYSIWAGTNAGGGAPDADYDQDGVRNGVEYFMGIVTPGFTATPGIVEVAGIKKITWPHSAAATGATFKVFTSENLSTWTDVTTAATDADGKVEYIVPTATPSLFVRLEVTVAP